MDEKTKKTIGIGLIGFGLGYFVKLPDFGLPVGLIFIIAGVLLQVI